MTAKLPLAQRLSSSGIVRCPIGELWMAAERRLREAETLLLQGEYHGSVYLAGYAVEMTLGYCYARCSGANLKADADTLLTPARVKAENDPALGPMFVKTHFRGGHSPIFWWKLLIQERQRGLRPLPEKNRKQIESLVYFVQRAWEVWLRYRTDGATKQDALELIGQARRIKRELKQVRAWR